MFRPLQKIACALTLLAFSAGAARFQTPSATPESTDPYQIEQQGLCAAQAISGSRTYDFRILPRADLIVGTYIARTWLHKLFPFLTPKIVNDDKYNIDDIRYMQTKIGRPIPVGSSPRTKKANSQIEQWLINEQARAEQNWQKWLDETPNAPAEEIKRAEIDVRFKGLNATRLPRFDWREHGLNVGEVGFQGFDCNTCWAFTSVDAMQISRRLAALRGIIKNFDETLQPSAAQLISCMVPKNKYCKVNWHGAAFTFMVEKGLPLGGTTEYIPRQFGHNCDAENSVKALTWDYVSAQPQKVSSREEIKKAVIAYGAVVTTMTFDRCLWLYRSGVFNEEQNHDGSHIVIIIGWDDSKGWLIKNSYGTDWGENGFGWIKYEANNIGQFSAVVVADPNEKIKRFGKKKR